MRTSRAAAIATACVLVAPLLTAAPAAADAVRWSHLDGRDSGKLASGLSSSVAGSNLKRTGDLTPESWWGNDSSWNRYSYVENRPLIAIDPNGEDLYIVYDFVGSGLSMAQQNAVVMQVRQRFLNAGVNNVYSHYAGGTAPKRGSLGKYDARVDISFTSEPIGREGKLGGTDIPAQESEVTTSRMPPGKAGITLLSNVAAHEIGHATHAMPDYNFDAAKKGSFWHPRPAEEGTLMESQVGGDDPELQIRLLSSGPREASDGDAAKLRTTLNSPGQ